MSFMHEFNQYVTHSIRNPFSSFGTDGGECIILKRREVPIKTNYFQKMILKLNKLLAIFWFVASFENIFVLKRCYTLNFLNIARKKYFLSM